jgi:FemAB-related protein (PEP-CTERM system-associated)
MKVAICNEPQLWDAYVESRPDASNYHRWRWRKPIEDTFGHASYYLAAREDEYIQGVLPLFWIRSHLFGSFLVSVPFFSYGGVLADTPPAREALLTEAAALARKLGARHVELRQGDAADYGWCGTSAKVMMEVELPPTADELWKRLSSRLRNKIRNAEKAGFRARWGGIEDVEHFYPVFADNMRNLGTPVYPRSWFENLCAQAPESIRIITLWDGKQPVAGAFLSPFRETMEAPWIASLPEGRKRYSSVLLYWTFLRYAIEQGSKRFDLGRCTPGGGTYEFKRLWGCIERPLHWYYWLAPGTPVPALRPDNGKFQLAIRVWKHLPLFVANQLGPRIVRSLP